MVTLPLSLMSICMFYMRSVLSSRLPCAKSTLFNDLKQLLQRSLNTGGLQVEKPQKGNFLPEVIFSPLS